MGRRVELDWRGSLMPPVATRPGDSPMPWHYWFTRGETLTSFLLLVLPTVLSTTLTDRPSGYRPATLAVAAAAAVWLVLRAVLLGTPAREHPVFTAVHFAGVLPLAAVLQSRDPYFVLFMVYAYFAAMRMRPMPLAITGVALTSALINTMSNGGPIRALADQPWIWLTLMLLQTVAIGGGGAVFAAVGRQNEERRRTLERLAAAEAENRGLQQQLLVQAREAGMLDERQRMSQEIHDTLAQGFTGIITQLEAADQARDDPATRQRHLRAAAALARENLSSARRSVEALHPEPLDAATLPEALAGVVDRWSAQTGVPATFSATGTVASLHPELEATLLRITQEALSNVAKHARAGRVGLTLSYMGDEVTLDVRDDGAGFDPAAPPADEGGFGLPGMRRRAGRLAGTLTVESEPGGGTAVSVNLPAVPAATLESTHHEGAPG
ncbi:sensor histidine kinase [Amycolatopsis jiangsuensis]|uniref:Oxygen sensor histidine kinase NreB n=1 Tax=Amycolatopsis jiangsuensis TaxID=1181879 RepID=A0A840INA0_9PSEU|nr:sensor histidine kinase [Amycolatopsis jiangsuensis]MBB4682935.1 signal transduction histidine kinase [Amycolatopsis jiangsuensis]